MRTRVILCAVGVALWCVYALVRGIICVERQNFYYRDWWRDLRRPDPAAFKLNPVPAAPPSPNPTGFEAPEDGTQMSNSQVRRVIDAIQQTGKGKGVNLLVFGLGHDSAYWNRVNSGGYTVFVEDSPVWIERIMKVHPELQGKVVQYSYRTRNHRDTRKYWDEPRRWESLFMFEDLPAESPLVQLQGKFDVVIVDAPMGMQWCEHCVGRMQSLWTARVMVRPHGHIVVDDCERLTEKAFSLRFYGDANVDGMVDRFGTEPGEGQWQCYYRMDYALPHPELRGPKLPKLEPKEYLEGKP